MREKMRSRSRCGVGVLAFVLTVAGCLEADLYSLDAGEGDSGGDGGTDSAADGDSEPDGDGAARCGDGFCSSPRESAESCPEDCAGCSLLADITDLIGTGELFYGYSALGTETETLGCGALGEAKEISLSLTPDFTGDLVLSTRYPSTQIDTVLEVRRERCDGEALGCNDVASPGTPGSVLTIPVEAETQYVALVETADDEAGVFALGLHRPGVCEGLGITEDITGDLLTGRRFVADTSASTASLAGSCSPAEDGPEVRYTFTAPRSGLMIATTAHPSTTFDPVLHVREGEGDGRSACDSPESEVACAAGGAGPRLRFDVRARRRYDLFVDGDGGHGQATLTLGYGAESPARASLRGCDFETIRDGFAFFAQSGREVFVTVDTVDAETAADTRLLVRLPDGAELHEADDDVDCTFDPPAWSCPQHRFTAGTTGLFTVEVYVGSSEACYDRHLVNYELTVTVDGEPSELILVRDQ